MPRHYTDAEKRLVLDRLIANHGDVPRTATETGVSDRTLLRWRTENDIKPPSYGFMASPPTTTSPTQNQSSLPSPVATGEGLGLGVSPLPPNTAEA